MFDFVYKHRKKIQIIILALIVPPFALFGVDVYFRGGESARAVATVGDYAITQDEFSRALRERQASLQRAIQGRVDPSMLDNPEVRRATLETLIQRRLLVQHAQTAGLMVTNEHLRGAINEVAVFRDESGKFSYPRYEQFLKSEGMTPAMFEARLRQDILLRQVADGYADSSFVPRTVSGLIETLAGQQREVSHAAFQPDAYLSQVKLAPEAAKQYYDANTAEFRVPEQARVEYVVLSIDALMQAAAVSPEDVKKFYESNRAQFGVEESREAAHILVGVDSAAGASGKEKAKAQADSIYRELQKNPAGFADAAKKHSADPGSASQGGSLGRITRGSMRDVPEFEQALYALKPGEISQPVETKLGFHIIRLTVVHPSQVKPFEEVREGIEKELKKQQAARRFAELADGFNNVVYEQSDTLKPAAELAKVPLRQSGWITRERADPPLNHPKLAAAIFSDEAFKDRRNTEAVETAPGMLAAARVIEARPASIQPFEEVRAALEKRLALREASRLATAEGRRQLEELKQGKPAKAAWSAPVLVARDADKGLPEAVVRQAFRVGTDKLPAYTGTEDGRGYTLVRVSRVEQAAKMAPEKAKGLEEQVRALLSQETLAAYVASLKQKAGVKINKEQLDKKDR